MRAAPACQQPAHEELSRGPFRDAVAQGEGGFLDLESAPTGPWGPSGLSLARGLWAQGLAGVRGLGGDAWPWGGGEIAPPRWEIPYILPLGL